MRLRLTFGRSNSELVFENGSNKKQGDSEEPQAAELYEQIGRLKVQLEWLK